MAEHNDLGNLGEKRAAAYLVANGYTIRETNWKASSLELDIIAQKDDCLVIVEVKTRSNENFEHPEDAITSNKIRNIVNAANRYIFKFDWQGDTRFDVITVIPHGDESEIVHIEDAFLPPMY
ncbi:MAG: hypothetical protein AUK44_00730 [Porphyromonadaceae bacterium CG2_30_38_12]|nr:MAG: hypothetical protein AUK44_00730 [Porphyromonadaceae bacterium CG2_30_38_12]